MNLKAVYKGKVVMLNDICYTPLSPYNNECTLMSPTSWFQNNVTRINEEATDATGWEMLADYHDHLMSCTR